MSTMTKLYDEFYTWLDTKVPPVQMPTLFEELQGFELSATCFLDHVKHKVFTGSRYDQYLDVLFELWYKHVHSLGERNDFNRN